MPSNWGWRIPSLLQITPSCLQIIFIYFLPESPRWLISKGRGDEAYAILTKYHAEGDTKSEFVQAEYAQIEKTLELEMETSKMTWKELVSTSGMRKRLLIGSFLGLVTQVSLFNISNRGPYSHGSFLVEWQWFNFVSIAQAGDIPPIVTFISRYFLARILDNVGIHDNRTKNLINLANTCWGFLNATILALTVSRFKRRTMYLVRSILSFSSYLC